MRSTRRINIHFPVLIDAPPKAHTFLFDDVSRRPAIILPYPCTINTCNCAFHPIISNHLLAGLPSVNLIFALAAAF